MNKEVHFLFDEEWEEQQKELLQIFHETSDPELHKNVFLLETFVRAAAFSFIYKKKHMSHLLGKEITKPKYYQKVLDIPSGIDVQPVPVPSTETKIQPVQQFKEIPLYTQKIFLDSGKEGLDFTESTVGKKNLIIDRITNRVLASASVTDEYLLEEPLLDDKDIKVLEKAAKKRLKSVEKGWELIQKYGKKYSILAGHDTSIKYYLVNDLFGMGKIEPFLHDSDVISLQCAGVNENVFVEIGGKKILSNVRFNDADLNNFIHGVAGKLNKKITKKIPNVKGFLRGFTFMVGFGDDMKNPHFVIKRGEES